MKIPIVIVDDNTQNRNSLKDQIGYSDDIVVRFTAKNGVDFFRADEGVAKEHAPFGSVDGY